MDLEGYRTDFALAALARVGATHQMVVQIQRGRTRKGGANYSKSISKGSPVRVAEAVSALLDLQAQLPVRVGSRSSRAVNAAVIDLGKKPTNGVKGVCRVLKKLFQDADGRTWRVEVENACGHNLQS